jgi:hypothetical protein
MSFPDLHHTHGSVERVHRDLGFLLRALLSEFQLPIEQWQSVLALAMSAINGSPTSRLGGKTPREVFMGPSNPDILASIVSPSELKVISAEEWSMKQKEVIEDLVKSWNEVCDSLKEKVEEKVES